MRFQVAAYHGTPADPTWLNDEASAELLNAVPTGNVPVSLVKNQIQHFVDGLPGITPHIDQIASERAEVLGDAHTRVRKSAKVAGSVEVVPVLPGDILGCFILLPDTP